MKKTKTTNLVISAVLMAVGMILPFFTGQIPEIGSMISPMHLPVLICGYVCGWKYGLAVGFLLPLIRSLTFGMPPLFPTAAAMAVEMAVYGAVTGIMYQVLPKRNGYIYVSLVLAMLLGRIAWGLASIVLYGIKGGTYTMEQFLTGAFIRAIPAIIIQLVLVPLLVVIFKKAKYIK
ncbi:MAG: ECF transporter S component [Lachnospiraceae bacterium]